MTTASSIPAENLAGNRALVSCGTRETGAAVTARLKGAVSGERYNGGGAMTFTLRGDRIARMVITG
jgi:hypothetical protein